VFAGGPPARLINVYGPTESTTFATWKEVTRDSLDRPTIPIGKPIFNTTVLLLDDALNPVPVGVVGEIFIGGDGLANGYLNRPELNDERFVDAPAHKISVSPLEGTPTRLYRTGDLAKYLPNGDIEYIGRKDTQVKIRGFRIELGEIESLIESHPQVSQSVVVAVRDARDHRMAAFYVPHSDTNIDAGDLKEYVRQKLPNYMVPAALIELPAFPINRNGKIDRRSLDTRALSHEVAFTHAPADATDELELKLTWIWKEVLGVSSVGIHDNFFDLGGHSLAAVKVFSEIEKGLGCRLQLATLFHAPTIAELAQVIRDGGWAAKWRSLVPIRSAGTKAPFFCVHAVGGNILEYNELAHYLSADQPFYGLQSLGLEGSSEPLTDISSMAAAYVDEIRTLQPKGPYHLGGRSFGGTVAYEMARQLREAGEEIAMLAIFDSYPRGWQKLCSPELTREHERTFLKLRAERHLRIWLELRTLDKIRYAATKIGYKSRKLKNLGWRIVQKLRPPADSVGSRIRRIEEINYGAHRSYVPNTYEGKVTFFCAKEEVCPEENLTGWRLLAKGGVDVIDVPGDHQTMIRDPHVAVLAEKLEDALAYRDAGKETE
jgi:thioesterase domain-containing protein/acyl carrier protein